MALKSSEKNNLNILVLSHTSDITGGAELSMLNVFDALAKNYNVKPTFILRKPLRKMVGALDERNWKYIALDYGFWSNVPSDKGHSQLLREEQANNRTVLKIEKLITDMKPDVVVTNSIVCPWAATAAYLTGTPHVWFVREYGDLDHGRIFTLGREATFQAIDAMSNLVISNSMTLANHIKKYVPAEKVSTLYTPISVQELIEKSAAIISSPFIHSNSLKLVIASGSVTTSKGHLEIVQAVAALSQLNYDIEVCLIGRTDNKKYVSEINNLIKAHNISDKVHFVGFVDNPLPFMALADVGIMTSRMEAFGRVTFEYLALGKPVIGANSGATPEMVHDGVNGYLFDLTQPDTLVQALRHYLDDKDLIEQHGTESKKVAQAMMSKEQNVHAFYSNLTAMLQNVKKQPRPLPPVGLINHLLSMTIHPPTMEGQQSAQGQLKQRVRHHAKPIYHAVRAVINQRISK
jgi:glycosyltransferase involved in cell wall biosynthesis